MKEGNSKIFIFVLYFALIYIYNLYNNIVFTNFRNFININSYYDRILVCIYWRKHIKNAIEPQQLLHPKLEHNLRHTARTIATRYTKITSHYQSKTNGKRCNLLKFVNFILIFLFIVFLLYFFFIIFVLL
jgi:hypothetical protein